MKSFFNKIKNQSKANQKLFAKTELIENTTEDIMLAMDKMGLSKVELSRRLGKSKSYVTQLLSGSRNMTLSSLSDLCFELDIKPEIKILEASEKLDFTNIKSSQSIYWEKENPLPKTSNSYGVNRTVVKLEEHPEYKKAA
jgi:antitoxin component HigA of HigAB toxin-antitoxin module